MRIAAGERVVIVGPPRSGKTNLEAWLLGGLGSVVVIDSKMHPREWAWWGPRNGYVVTSEPDDIARNALVVFQPDHRWLMDAEGWRRQGSPGWNWTRALQRVWERGRTHVVFDETVQTLPAGRPHPTAMRLYTQGAAYGITTWAGTQIGNRIETLSTRMAEHCICFWLPPREADLVASSRGQDPKPLSELQPFHFVHHRQGPNESWTHFGPVENLFSGADSGGGMDQATGEAPTAQGAR